MRCRTAAALRRRARRDDGFTLIELMMAIAIFGIVMGPIAAATIIGLRTTDETSNRLAGSNDAQLVSIYLPPDVQSADDALVSGIACSGASNPRVQLQSTDGVFNVVYGVRQAGDGSWQLVRYTCPANVVAATKLVASNLAGADGAVVTRTPASGTFSGVTMQVTEAATPTDPTGYQFSVTATRRTTT